MFSAVLVNVPLSCETPLATSCFITSPITFLPVLTELKLAGELLVTPRLIAKVPFALQWLVGEVRSIRVSLDVSNFTRAVNKSNNRLMTYFCAKMVKKRPQLVFVLPINRQEVQ